MASSFSVSVSMSEAPAAAQAKAVNALEDAARRVGLRLTRRGGGELGYRPRVQFPFLLMLWHYLSGERMTIRFEAGASGGTTVTLSGAVARAALPVASDPAHWADPLGASASASQS
ncbi:MAG TPA: hypothetical protein VID68_05495 [Solirubrobacteraceae bacterium]